MVVASKSANLVLVKVMACSSGKVVFIINCTLRESLFSNAVDLCLALNFRAGTRAGAKPGVGCTSGSIYDAGGAGVRLVAAGDG